MAKLENKRYESFCQNYVAHGWNATQAAKDAGYSDKTAYSQGARLLKRVEIQKRIDEIVLEGLGMQREQLKAKVLEEWKAIAFHDVTDDINVLTTEVHEKEWDPVNEKFVMVPREMQIVTIKDTKGSKNKKAIAGIKQTKDGIVITYHDKKPALERLGQVAGLIDDGLQPKKVELEISELSPEERKARLAELMEKAGRK